MAVATDAPASPARDGQRPRLRDLDRRLQLALAAIVLIGFAVRAYAALNPVENPGPDAEAYASLARWLFEEQRYGAPDQESASDWSPGAPLLYAAVYYLTGGINPTIARLVIAVLGAAMVLCVFLLAVRLSRRPAAGLIGALVVATYPTYIENSGQFLSEPLAAFLLPAGLLAFLWAAEQRRLAAWLLPGLAFGALILTRPEYQAITAVFVLFAVWRVWRDRGGAIRRDREGGIGRDRGGAIRRDREGGIGRDRGDATRRDRGDATRRDRGDATRRDRGGAIRPAVLAGLVVVAGATLIVGPWTIHNRIVLDRWVPVSTGGQKALFVATYLPGLGRQVPTKRELMRRLKGYEDPITTDQLKAQPMEPLLTEVARRRYPNMDRDAALGRIGRENARKYITEQPLAYAEMSWLKFWTMWNRGSSPFMADAGWVAYHRVLLLLGIAGFALLVRARATRFQALLLAVPIAAISVIGTVLLAVPRRQVPLMPIVAVFAGIAVVWAVARLRERRAGSPPAGA